MNARKKEVQRLQSKNKLIDAVIASLAEPPLSCKDAELKDDNYHIVAGALARVRDDRIPKAVEKINDKEMLDNLIKYIYRGLSEVEEENENRNARFLKWHEYATKKAGKGSIIRVLTDRHGV